MVKILSRDFSRCFPRLSCWELGRGDVRAGGPQLAMICRNTPNKGKSFYPRRVECERQCGETRPQLRRAAVIVLEQSAQALAAGDFTRGCADRGVRLNELVCQPLMVAFGVKMFQENRRRVAEHPLAKEDHFVQAFGFDRPDPAFGERIEVGALRRQADRLYARRFQEAPELFGEFGVSIHQEVRFAVQEPILAVGEVAGDLCHPSGIGGSCDARDLHATSGDLHDEENIERDEAAQGPNFGGEEITSCHCLGMRAEEVVPSGFLRSNRRRLDAMPPQNARHGRVADLVTEVRQHPLDFVEPSAGIPPGQFDGQVNDFLTDGRPAWILALEGPFMSDEFPMPPKERVRSDQAPDFKQPLPPDLLSLCRQTSSLIVGEPMGRTHRCGRS